MIQVEDKTLYEDFMFFEYLFRPENFPSSYDYIVKNLYTILISYLEDVPTTFASNVGPSDIINIISRPEHLYKTNNNLKTGQNNERVIYLILSVNDFIKRILTRQRIVY